MKLHHPRIRLLIRAVLLMALVSIGRPVFCGLEEEIGRNEIRIWSAPYVIEIGTTVPGAALPERLDRLGYRRVHQKPTAPGEYFWGHERFWIYRRAHHIDGRDRDAELFSLTLRRNDARITGLPAGGEGPGKDANVTRWLEPELQGESFQADRAPRRPVRFGELPDHVWQSVLAAEDSRFFDHRGLDARGIARALLKNALAGQVVQGGSTITQQLVKVRDLTPQRTLGRKVSEALRALDLEADYDKEQILQAYLNCVYFGHLEGVSLYGLGAASKAFFSKHPAELDLAQAALLAGMIQGPNRLSPVRNPERARERQRWVLERMEELGWATAQAAAETRNRGLPKLNLNRPSPAGAGHILAWIRETASQEAPKRYEDGRGFVVETTLDPLLQDAAEEAVREGLKSLRKRSGRLVSKPLTAALICLDARDGHILAYVGGDSAADGDEFDRVRKARRQPGSAVKPLVLLGPFEGCGREDALYPARRVADAPVRIDLPSGPWEPENFDGKHRGVVSIREALVQSLNVPFVRIGRWCGFERTAEMLRNTGLEIPDAAPPAMVLGAVETSPFDLARAYTIFVDPGHRVQPGLVRRLAKPSDRTISRHKARRRRVAAPSTAYLIRNLMHDAVERGTSRAAGIEGAAVFGKTGTSSGMRDAWFAGGSGPLVTVVWVGLDDGNPLGMGGSTAAAPIWRDFMTRAIPTRPPRPDDRPDDIVERWVQERTGLLVNRPRRDAKQDLFRRGSEPPRRRFFRADQPVPVIE